MRLLWVFCALLAGSGVTAEPIVREFETFRDEMAEYLLAGDRPFGAADVLILVKAMPPAEKMQAVIYLRRLGLYTGAPIPLDQIVPLTGASPTIGSAGSAEQSK